jgi:hypothetical protein
LIAPVSEICKPIVSTRSLVSASPELRFTTMPTLLAAALFLPLQRRPISAGAKPGAAAVELPRGETTTAEMLSSPAGADPSVPL